MTLIYTFTLKITVIIYIDDLRTFLYVFKRKWKEKKKKVKGFPFLLIVMIFFLTWSYDISNTLQIISVFQQSNNYIIEIFYWKDCRLSEVVVPICSFWSVHCFAKCVCSTSLTFGLLWLSIHFVSFHQESQDSEIGIACVIVSSHSELSHVIFSFLSASTYICIFFYCCLHLWSLKLMWEWHSTVLFHGVHLFGIFNSLFSRDCTWRTCSFLLCVCFGLH